MLAPVKVFTTLLIDATLHNQLPHICEFYAIFCNIPAKSWQVAYYTTVPPFVRRSSLKIWYKEQFLSCMLSFFFCTLAQLKGGHGNQYTDETEVLNVKLSIDVINDFFQVSLGSFS